MAIVRNGSVVVWVVARNANRPLAFGGGGGGGGGSGGGGGGRNVEWQIGGLTLQSVYRLAGGVYHRVEAELACHTAVVCVGRAAQLRHRPTRNVLKHGTHACPHIVLAQGSIDLRVLGRVHTTKPLPVQLLQLQQVRVGDSVLRAARPRTDAVLQRCHVSREPDEGDVEVCHAAQHALPRILVQLEARALEAGLCKNVVVACLHIADHRS